MASSKSYDNEFIVGSSANSRLTPYFKLKEFLRPNGKIFVHRELIAGLKLLAEKQSVEGIGKIPHRLRFKDLPLLRSSMCRWSVSIGSVNQALSYYRRGSDMPRKPIKAAPGKVDPATRKTAARALSLAT
jgi:hypothetical protein